jgi:hypothetical protein
MTMPADLGDRQTAEPKTTRIVVVLGRRKKVQLRELVDRAWRERVPLVIINLGFPLTRSQQLVVEGALQAAATGAIALEAMIAYDARQAVSFFRDGDEIVYAASRAERGCIRDVLG